MPKIEYIEGNLITSALNGDFDVIVHGCNCFNTMGAGIAKQIKNVFPAAHVVDQRTCCGTIDKLGTFSKASVTCGEHGDRELVVINAYTQYSYGGGKQNADYKAIEEVFVRIVNAHPTANIGIPKIGAGLAGGDWDVIEGIINKVLTEQNFKGTITCVLYKGD